MRPLWIAGLAALLLAAAAVAGVAQPQRARSAPAATAEPRSITVTGNGSVRTVPDRAAFGFTVDTRGATAATALAQNATAARSVIAAVKAAGVADEDVQTSQVSLSPQSTPDGTSIVGYSASNTITVQARDLARAGRLVDAAVGAGATGVSGPSLSRSDQDALYRTALKAAVAQAQTKAVALAEAAKVSLGEVRTIVEGGGGVPVPFAAAGKADSSGTPIEPGTQTVDATVTVTYAVG
jgi:uncharacterized protein YggE